MSFVSWWLICGVLGLLMNTLASDRMGDLARFVDHDGHPHKRAVDLVFCFTFVLFGPVAMANGLLVTMRYLTSRR